jgi:flagellin-like protein
MNRKAQSQIITTVLIILLVLAAIVIVWQVVQGTVRSGAEQLIA